jgi:hypothetical protein
MATEHQTPKPQVEVGRLLGIGFPALDSEHEGNPLTRTP